MAKTENGILDSFIGKVGTVVGYKWNGKACIRAYTKEVKNPRTALQVAHREMFKQEVQLAAKMHWAVSLTLRDLAREAGMTAYNLFVKANQRAFGFADGSLQVDYSSLHLSFGDVPPVENPEASRSEANVLSVSFRRGRGAGTDYVYLYAYAPDLGEGYLSAPVYRHEKRLSLALPDHFGGHAVHLYLLVQHAGGNWGNSQYIGALAEGETTVVASEEALPQALQALSPEGTLALSDGGVVDLATGEVLPDGPDGDKKNSRGRAPTAMRN